MSPDYKPQVLTEARLRLGWTKAEAARRLGKKRMIICRSEDGKNTSLKVLRNICALYQIPLSAVLNLDVEETAERAS